MRISGLSSGMDTEQMIKDIMTAQRIPVDRVFQQKVKAEWKRDAYRDVNVQLQRLKNLAFDMKLQGTFQKNVASSSNTSVLTANATGAAQKGTYDVKVTGLASAAQFVSKPVSFELPDGETRPDSFIINGANIDISNYESPKDLVAGVAEQINKNKELGINAFAHGDQISFTTKATGADARIIVDENFTDIFGGSITDIETIDGNAVGLLQDQEGQSMQGQNAELVINGLQVEQSSNSFAINGININLLEADTGTTVRIEVRQDVDAVVDKITEFVNLYNELVDDLNLATREKVYRDFPPLTDAQRADMSDKDIELWEEKAKSGLLRSDSMLSGILSEMRVALGAAVQDVDGNNQTLAQIGVTTGSWYEYGRLNINEGKLRAAIEQDPQSVQNLFTNSGAGLAHRLEGVLDRGIKRITETAGKATDPYDKSFFGERIRGYESRLDAMEERLIRYEEAQWRKFTAMERVLGQLYSQSDWLYQQLATMQG